jgi:hypothetical protein
MKLLGEPLDFDWDEGNLDKNWEKHRVINTECEEIFFDENKRILKDKMHSDTEERYIILGKTKEERLLYLVFTIRNDKVRVISARDINKKERRLYEKTN